MKKNISPEFRRNYHLSDLADWCPHCDFPYDEDNESQPCCGLCGHPFSCDCDFANFLSTNLIPSIEPKTHKESKPNIDSIFESEGLTETEKEEVKKYVSIFQQQGFIEHWEVNEWISGNDCWDEFENMRSINDHVNAKGIKGIQPRFFAIVCKILNITDSGGSHLIKSEPY